MGHNIQWRYQEIFYVKLPLGRLKATIKFKGSYLFVGHGFRSARYGPVYLSLGEVGTAFSAVPGEVKYNPDSRICYKPYCSSSLAGITVLSCSL